MFRLMAGLMTFSCDFILIMSSKFDDDSIDKSKQRQRQGEYSETL